MFASLKRVIATLFFDTVASFLKQGLTKTFLEALARESDSQFGIVSAYRSDLSRNENKQRHTKLAQEIDLMGYSYKVVQGAWSIDSTKNYVIENSFLIYNIDTDSIFILGDMFDQEAIIYKLENEPVILYNLKNRTKQTLNEVTIESNIPRPRFLNKEDLEPQTRDRDTVIKYQWGPEESF